MMLEEFDPVAYINGSHWQQMRPGLERIRELMGRLGDPQKNMRFVHVAGTNGKGSTCAYIAEILRQAGYHVGLFTSPFILEFSERIRIDGVNIPDDELERSTLLVRDQAEKMEDHPTEFELMTAVALVAFSHASIDIAVLEVGLGGRLDSTNVIEAPEVCALTPIALDHTNILGDTLAQIAQEKAGIIKEGATVVCAPQQDEAMQTIEQKCESMQIDLHHVLQHDLSDRTTTTYPDGSIAQTFSYRSLKELRTRLLGVYQPENAALAIEIAWALRDRGFAISDEHIWHGIDETRWPGRFEIVATHPTIIVDGGHNPQGAHVLADSLRRYFPDKKIVFIIGVLADKDYAGMLAEVFELAAGFVLVKPPSPRALPISRLCTTLLHVAGQQGGCPACLRPYLAEDFNDALDAAKRAAGQDGIVCAFGSLYSIKALMDALKENR